MFLPSTAGKVLARSSPRTTCRPRRPRRQRDPAHPGHRVRRVHHPALRRAWSTRPPAPPPARATSRCSNLTMPGVAGLDGSRTYTAAEGAAIVAAQDSRQRRRRPRPPRRQPHLPPRLLPPRPDAGRHRPPAVRLLALRPRGPRRRRRRRPRPGRHRHRVLRRHRQGPADWRSTATRTTRWAVAVAERTRRTAGSPSTSVADRSFDRVTLRWETAAGSAYRVQGSADGQTWTDLVRFPEADLTSTGGWLSVDGRAGLVVRGAAQPPCPSTATWWSSRTDPPSRCSSRDCRPATRGRRQAAAARPAPAAGAPAVRASTAGGHLSLFNLSGSAVTTVVAVPQDRSRLTLFAGAQTVTADGTDYTAELDAASAQVAAARFTLRPAAGRVFPPGSRPRSSTRRPYDSTARAPG